MGVKTCSVQNCLSSSSRPEDKGVTYHKFPKNNVLRETWVAVTRYKKVEIDSHSYICSRHFCKSDFQLYQDSKYVLKSEAVPTIFPWSMSNLKSELKMDALCKEVPVEDNANTSTGSKESEGENVDAIKKFIEEQEKEINNQTNDSSSIVQKSVEDEATNVDEEVKVSEKLDVIEQTEPMVIATSVMDMILSESEAKIANKNELKPIPQQSLSPEDKGNSVSLSVGSKVEAKDFAEIWYRAEILEVDYDEMEVLVHYDNATNKHDEWISVSSPRLRPINKSTLPLTPVPQEPTGSHKTEEVKLENMEDKLDDKSKLTYVVGERCLARWRDNRRFVATIKQDLGNGKYEIVFDDGFQWKCTTSRLSKLKDSSGKTECLSVDTSMSPSASTPSPILAGSGPTGALTNTNPLLPFHTHLFDPTRDYLGSKSERREMKRKLNIKEIFNIGQKQKKKQNSSTEKVVKTIEKKPKRKYVRKALNEIKTEIKTEIPDAVASIIGTVDNSEEDQPSREVKMEVDEAESSTLVDEKIEEIKVDPDNDEIDKDDSVDRDSVDSKTDTAEPPSDIESQDSRTCVEPAVEEEMELENFETPDDSKQEVIEKMKEVINKLEDGLNQVERVDSPKPEEVSEVSHEEKAAIGEVVTKADSAKEKKKKLSKIKKSKKLRLLQEKKVKSQVEKVKSELEEMKRQVEEMRKQMLLKTEGLATPARPQEMPESFLLPGEWCCKWVNNQPVGTVCDIEAETKDKDADGKSTILRRTVQVEDKRLPPGWTKHMVRRSLGQSAGKWDVVLLSPDGRRLHTKVDMRNYLEFVNDESLKPYEHALLDFGIHLKLSRRMGWVSYSNEEASGPTIHGSASPLTKTKKFRLTLKKGDLKKGDKIEKKKKKKKVKIPRLKISFGELMACDQAVQGTLDTNAEMPFDNSTLEDGYVYVGSLKVQVIENLLRCPAEGCFKNFRNNTLIQMHIKHYHRELRKMLGATPKVLDLATKRSSKPPVDVEKPKRHDDSKVIKVKIPRPPKRVEEPKTEAKEPNTALEGDIPTVSLTKMEMPIPRSQDSPKLRQALANRPVKRPKVLLPVRKPDSEQLSEKEEEEFPDLDYNDGSLDTSLDMSVPPLDFETAISTHTVTKPADDLRKKSKKSGKCFSTVSKKPFSEDDEWYGMNSDLDTRSSFPGSGTPDSKTMDKTMANQLAASSESNNEEQKESNMYMYTETGERVKIEHMKREEIINCHCGFREEDGLMVQCELCLCWQHALCHNIQKEAEVPEKYTCSICLNPRRGRRSKRFLHDQDRLYEGLLPGAKPCESLRRSHELSGNLLRIQDALHAMRVKYYVATKKDHPKLYLWAKDWEASEVNFTQERLNSDYSDLNIIINNIGKENLPVRPDDVRDVDMRATMEDDSERFNHRDPNYLLSMTTALSSPSGPSLDLPITTSELERLARSVQEQEVRITAPQPEAAIENSACRERLLRHVQRCQALIDARLDSIEAQVAELESQDPSFEDDETADYFPRTKQTIQMLMRDLDTMEELGIIT